jgi:hypothetical protein
MARLQDVLPLIQQLQGSQLEQLQALKALPSTGQAPPRQQQPGQQAPGSRGGPRAGGAPYTATGARPAGPKAARKPGGPAGVPPKPKPRRRPGWNDGFGTPAVVWTGPGSQTAHGPGPGAGAGSAANSPARTLARVPSGGAPLAARGTTPLRRDLGYGHESERADHYAGVEGPGACMTGREAVWVGYPGCMGWGFCNQAFA